MVYAKTIYLAIIQLFTAFYRVPHFYFKNLTCYAEYQK